MGRIWPAATPDPGDRYTPEELRHIEGLSAYPGGPGFTPLAGIAPAGGVPATVTGSTVTVRDMVGRIVPTGAPWTEDSGGYVFVLHSEDLSVSPAHSTLERIDLLVARLTDHEIDGSGTREAVPVIIEGTPGSGAPALGVADLHLATVTVPAGGSPSIAPSGLYTTSLGGINPFHNEGDMPPPEFSGQAAYNQETQALMLGHGGAWGVAASRRGYQWGRTVRYTSSGTFSKANYPGCRAVRVKVQGGGGGGGGSRATASDEGSSSGGGGGGCYAEAVILASSLGASVTVTVGAGGSSPAGGEGNNGGSSSFGAFVVAPGGDGGFDRAPSTGHAASSGAAGSPAATITGHVSGTELEVTGGGGGAGYSLGASVISGVTVDKGSFGHGGSSYLSGSGRNARGPSTAAQAGLPYGGGGSGNVGGWDGTTGEAAKSGGAGASGIVIVEVLY